jgi:hypothetical protein
MAARRNLQHSALVRDRIKTSQLVNRLTEHALGTIEMSPTQVQATGILLRKVLPDLKAIELSGPAGGPLQVEDARKRNLDLIDGVAARGIAGRAAGAAEPGATASGSEPAGPGGTAELPMGLAELVGEV